MDRSHSGAALDSVSQILKLPPRVMTVEQEKMAVRIERHVRRETNNKIHDLKVEVREAAIVLRGRCGTYYCKQLAQHAAMHLAESIPVSNLIDVW